MLVSRSSRHCRRLITSSKGSGCGIALRIRHENRGYPQTHHWHNLPLPTITIFKHDSVCHNVCNVAAEMLASSTCRLGTRWSADPTQMCNVSLLRRVFKHTYPRAHPHTHTSCCCIPPLPQIVKQLRNAETRWMYDATAPPARPCQRCIKRGMADKCTEGHRKKAKYLYDEAELGEEQILYRRYAIT